MADTTDGIDDVLNDVAEALRHEGSATTTPAVPGEVTERRYVVPELLPVLPIRDTVAFPGTIIPLTIGREKSKRLVDAVITGNKILGIVAQRRAEVEDPGLDDLYRVGTAAAILKLLRMPDGTQSIIVHGLVRFGIEDLTQTEPYLIARAHTREDTAVSSPELDALVQTTRRQAARVIELTPGISDQALDVLSSIEKPGALGDFLAANLQLDLVLRQELLETFDVSDRLRKIAAHLARQIEVLELSTKIQTQVKNQVEKQQREYYLQEQLRAIQRELGETDPRDAEIKELRERIAAAKMPAEVEAEATRELERLAKIPQASPEYSNALDYIEWLCDMPWAISTEDHLDIRRAEKILNDDHYDLDKVKRRILEFLAVRKLKPEGRGPILCFAGPPGVGKTSLGQSIARALGRKFIRVSLGGVRDEADIRGHRRTYIGALPGRILQEIRKAGSNNPVFMLDEVDKLGQDFRGDPSSALLEVLDPAQNFSFQDHYLDVPFDLSKVMFIATANYMDAVPPPLRDRMEVLELPGYTVQEKLFIAKKYLVKRQRDEHGLKTSQLKFDDSALLGIIENYTAEAGVRNLEREIAAICRATAARLARRSRSIVRVVRRADLPEFLGPLRVEPEVAMRTSTPGVVTGLAWTPTGGDILFVEATNMPGKGNLQLTGQIGDVMKESAQTAFSLVRSRAKSLGIDPARMSSNDFHIHVPAGAIPKDGPSAGVAMFTALVSLLLGRVCRTGVAMTGEITLRGLVLPIGGLKSKALAAHRAGIETVIIPKQNMKDLVDIPADVRKQLKFHPVGEVDEALRAALEKPTKRPPAKKAAPAEPTSVLRRVRRRHSTTRPRAARPAG
ncbi:MAG: endopeptidase La [Phycisphaerae bacterium]|nr:endopeptidase La [Phycisphaerae bacterium]